MHELWNNDKREVSYLVFFLCGGNMYTGMRAMTADCRLSCLQMLYCDDSVVDQILHCV